MSIDWKQSILAASKRRAGKAAAARFAALVEEVGDRVNHEIAAILMKTFSSEPDYGTQEHVVGVLTDAPVTVRQSAILDELPRLVAGAREWAYDLLGSELRDNPSTLIRIAKQKPHPVHQALQTLYEDAEFADECDEIERLAVLFQ